MYRLLALKRKEAITVPFVHRELDRERGRQWWSASELLNKAFPPKATWYKSLKKPQRTL